MYLLRMETALSLAQAFEKISPISIRSRKSRNADTSAAMRSSYVTATLRQLLKLRNIPQDAD
jgi:hypothetical protein